MGEFALSRSPQEIVIVDDDQIVSFLHTKVLERCGIRNKPLLFPNGNLAFDHLKANSESETSFLVLLDLNMPVMNGWEFLDECKEAGISNVYVIMVSSSINPSDAKRALDYKQVFGFIEKPLTKQKLQKLFKVPAIKEIFLQMEYEALENGTW